MTVARLLNDAQRGAAEREAHIAQIDAQIGWHEQIIAELKRARAVFEPEPPPWAERFGDNLAVIASGIAGRR